MYDDVPDSLLWRVTHEPAAISQAPCCRIVSEGDTACIPQPAGMCPYVSRVLVATTTFHWYYTWNERWREASKKCSRWKQTPVKSYYSSTTSNTIPNKRSGKRAPVLLPHALSANFHLLCCRTLPFCPYAHDMRFQQTTGGRKNRSLILCFFARFFFRMLES